MRNGQATIDAAVQSVLAQTERDIELVVINDGSTDGTAARLAVLAAGDSRVVVVEQVHRGLTASLNHGLSRVRGAYVARQDGDDESLPERLARQAAHLDTHPDVAAVGSHAEVMDGSGKTIGTLRPPARAADVRRDLLSLRSTPVHGAVMMRREVVASLGGYREAFPVGQDYDLWLRMSRTHSIENLPEVLYRWRVDQRGVYATRRAVQLRYAGIALAFAQETLATGCDSYGQLEQAAGDLDRFAIGYAHRARVWANWGEFLLRGVGNSPDVRRYFRKAIMAGQWQLRTLALAGWTHMGLPWPGGKPLSAPARTGDSR